MSMAMIFQQIRMLTMRFLRPTPLVLVDRATRTVAVKMSTWPTAQEPTYLIDTLRAFAATGRHLAGLNGRASDRMAMPGVVGVVEGRERGQS